MNATTESHSIKFSGVQLAISGMALTVMQAITFDKNVKPVDLDLREIEAISRKLFAAIDQLRSAGFNERVDVYAGLIPVELSDRELQVTIRSFEAVLHEWNGDPLELDMMVGPLDSVQATLAWLSNQ